MKALRRSGVAEQVLYVNRMLAMVSRKTLSLIMYKEMPDGSVVRYVEKPLALSRAVARLKELGYIVAKSVPEGEYLVLSDDGHHYADKMGWPNPLVKLSVDNKKDRKVILANSTALAVARAARIPSLPGEKPAFGDFARALGAITVFHEEAKVSSEELTEMLDTGVCFSRKEIRDAYADSTNSALTHNTAQQLGVIFKRNEVISLYQMPEKTAVLTTRGEAEFNATLMHDLRLLFSESKTNAYILAPTMNFLPTFFHGVIDGVETKNDFSKESVVDDSLAKFKIDKLPLYDKVFMLPVGDRYANYRENLDRYTDADYENDLQNFNLTHPGETNVIICRFPELTRLRKAYVHYDHVTIVGPNDEKMVDLLSRCMRDRLLKYFDIETGNEIKFRHYNTKGVPLIGNTNQIDYDSRWKLGGKFKKKS